MTERKTEMRKREVFLTVLLVGTAVFVQGCVAAAVGAGAAGTVAYVKGDLEAIEPKDLDTVYAATTKALEELELSITKTTKDALGAVIIAHDSRDKKIKVSLKATTENSTKLSIRYGWFGSKAKSNVIYQKIHDNLQ
jgi:hypothetical protein